jgi:uncharacterized protein YkwD
VGSRTQPLRLAGLGGQANLECALATRRITVGSAPDNSLVIDAPSVSRHHALLKRRFGRWRVFDLESTNGTFVNGRRIRGSVQLERGSEVCFGAERFAVLGGPASPSRIDRWRLWLEAIGTGILALFATGYLAAHYLIARHHRAGVSSPAATVSPADAAVRSRDMHTAPVSSSGGPVNAITGAAAARDKPATADAWLARLNHFRTMASVPAVTEDSALSLGDYAHARYMVTNFADRIRKGESLGPAMHTEVPGRYWYSIAGRDAAMASDVVEGYVPDGSDFSEVSTVDGWMAIPFHRLPLLSPLLRTAGYGQYCEAGVCVAALNAQSGAEPIHSTARAFARPVEFPPDGSAIGLSGGEYEWPDPLTACPGYSAPAGLAITLQFGTWMEPRLKAFTLARDGGAIDACGFDSASYRNSDPATEQQGREVLKSYGAVVLIPREPFHPGSRYEVSLTVDGAAYRWSFAAR